MAKLRNVAILLALTAAVWALPGGGEVAAVALATLTIVIFAGIVLIVGRFYRENRIAIFSLGDRHRALLYVSLRAFVVATAALDRLTGAGLLIWIAVVAACGFGVYTVWRHHRDYGY